VPKANTQRPCRTHLEPLPDASHGHHTLGGKLARIESDQTYGQLICECELATYADVTHAIVDRQARTIDDVRRDVRLGMGPCQGVSVPTGWRVSCTALPRVRQMVQNPGLKRRTSPCATSYKSAGKAYCRCYGGQQLRQERLDELIYLDVLNADHLPGPLSSRLGPEMYAEPSGLEDKIGIGICGCSRTRISRFRFSLPTSFREGAEGLPLRSSGQKEGIGPDILVIGGGLAGLVTAWQAARNGKKIRLVTKGWGTLHWGSGCVDVLGYFPMDNPDPLQSPAAGISKLVRDYPTIPMLLLISIN